MPDLVIFAPLTGWAAPLSEVPDVVFSDAMLGGGLAIEPTEGEVLAPFDGVVAVLPLSRHAVSIRSDDGLEVLIHVGLETVALKGEGFIAHVAEGQRVRTGDRLLSFNPQTVALGAKSLITPIVVTSAGWSVSDAVTDRMVTAGEPILRVTLTSVGAGAVVSGDAIEQTVISPLAHGLHARPAARVAAVVANFEAEVTLGTGSRTANAASPIAMMALGLKLGDAVSVSARGADAEAAVQAVIDLIAGGMGETAQVVAPPVAALPVGSSGPRQAADGEWVFSGVNAAPGLVIGRAVHLRIAEIEVVEQGDDATVEALALNEALATVRAKLEAAGAVGAPEGRSILAAQSAFLSDPDLIAAARAGISKGQSAAFAWRMACRAVADLLRSVGDPRMAERADDLLDIERQVLTQLTGTSTPPSIIGQGDVLLADDLLPSQLIALVGTGLSGICTGRGGPTSHVAILAAAMAVPALVAVGGGLDRVADGTLVVLDADGGRLIASPSAATQAASESRAAADRRRRDEARATAAEPCHTADGTRIEVFANLGGAAEAGAAVAQGAEGCGLLRTEFLFLDRDTAPSEDEQLWQYQAIADALDGRPLIVRTLDAGGDKPMSYVPSVHEDNPAMGLRGVRSGLLHPELLLTQLRAVCRVTSKGAVGIMLPMISSVAEVRQVRGLLDRAVADTGARPPLLGVMIETPAAAMTTDLLAGVVDFVSVGTNDLTQYALAMDRQNPHLAQQLDGLHPAVLRLIAATTAGGGILKWIGVCGALASDRLAAPILVGLGVTELSVSPAMVPEIKAVVRGLTLAECRALATQALTLDSPEAVRALARGALGRVKHPRDLIGAPA